MATDTAHIDLELASGRNEVTAPFQQTTQRRRRPAQQPFVESEELPANAPVVVDVPLSSVAASSSPVLGAPSRSGRPTWIALILATVAVAAVVWWVMSQRLPDIDPREVIQRNLGDARAAMAEGRYTDPPERSAFHHYSTVLALDPGNADAVAGIEAIADRHLTDARVLLADRRIAEAGLAIEKARRVKPHHSSLPALDTELRAELRKLLAAANAAAKTTAAKTGAAKVANISPARSSTPNVPPARSSPVQREAAASSPSNAPPEPKVTSTPSQGNASEEPPLLSFSPGREQLSMSQITPVAIDSAVPTLGESGSAPAIDEPAETAAKPASLPTSAPAPVAQTFEPRLVTMVRPEYPQEAIMRGIEGWVEVSLRVNAAGDVVKPRIEDSSRGRVFNRAALAAVQQWKYEPRADGQISERVRVRVQFRFSE